LVFRRFCHQHAFPAHSIAKNLVSASCQRSLRGGLGNQTGRIFWLPTSSQSRKARGGGEQAVGR
jgi:hypothetical protein